MKRVCAGVLGLLAVLFLPLAATDEASAAQQSRKISSNSQKSLKISRNSYRQQSPAERRQTLNVVRQSTYSAPRSRAASSMRSTPTKQYRTTQIRQSQKEIDYKSIDRTKFLERAKPKIQSQNPLANPREQIANRHTNLFTNTNRATQKLINNRQVIEPWKEPERRGTGTGRR